MLHFLKIPGRQLSIPVLDNEVRHLKNWHKISALLSVREAR